MVGCQEEMGSSGSASVRCVVSCLSLPRAPSPVSSTFFSSAIRRGLSLSTVPVQSTKAELERWHGKTRALLHALTRSDDVRLWCLVLWAVARPLLVG